jgi:hypothetical protein
MATTKIWDGTTWRDLEGPQGPEGPTVVSADAVNVAKIGTDGKILVAQADLDTRYVNVAGDNMTGSLGVKVGATFTPPATAVSPNTTLHVVRDGGGAVAEMYSVGTGVAGLVFRKKSGTLAAPTPNVGNTNIGVIRWQVKPNNGAADRTAAQINLESRSPETEDGYFDNTLGIGGSGYAAGQPNATLTLAASAAAGRVGTLSIDTFVCTATNFTVGGDGSVVSANGNFSVNTSGFIASKDGILVQRARLGTAGQFEISNVGSGETGYGIQAKCTGTSLTSGSITGVLGQVTGSVGTGFGIAATVNATATQNYGLAANVSGGTRNCGVYVDVTKGAGSWSVQCQGEADSYFKGNVGIAWSTPTNALEIGGAAMIRSTLNVVGNITSAGTAHSFAAGSIPSSAVVGGTAFTPATSAAAGAVGSMRWDENFLYVRTATAWKRVALAAF